MDLEIQAKNLEVDDRLHDQIATKLDRLDRRIKGITTALVELSANNSRGTDKRIVAQVTLDINGSLLRGEEKASSILEAVSSVVDVLDRRVERLKYKVYRSGQSRKVAQQQSPRTVAVQEAVDEEGGPENEGIGSASSIVRVKRFPIKPMTLDEAAFQMELSGHDFFLFLDSDGQQYSLLYKRKDGDYGLIQPEAL